MAESGFPDTTTHPVRSNSSTGSKNNIKYSLSSENKKIKSESKQNGAKSKVFKNTSSKEVEPTNASSMHQTTSSRPSSTGINSKKAPPVNRVESANRRTPTPTKQVFLKAVKRVEDRPWNATSDQYAVNVPSHNWTDPLCSTQTPSTTSASEQSRTEDVLSSDQKASNHQSCISKNNGSGDRIVVEDLEDDDSEDESEDESDLVKKAPNELLMEFLDCVMNADYVNGLKLCKMILLYEPDNEQALSFQSLIQFKINFDQEETVKDDEDNDDDDDDDDSTDESSEHESDEDDDSNSSSDSDEESVLKPIQEIVLNGPQIT